MSHRIGKLALLAGAAVVAVPAHADTLREALVEAYQTNPTLQAARADQRATDENVPIQKSSGLPSVNTTVTHTEFVDPSNNAFLAPKRNLGVNLALGVPIYSGGSVKNGIKAAKERVAAGQANLRATESSIFSQVVAAYMDVIRNEAIVGLSTNQVEVLSVNLQATEDRFEIGDLTRTDIAQSQSRLAVAQSDLRTAQANLINARETYIQLVGSGPDDLQPPPPLPGLPETVEDAVYTALENNPDLIAAKENAEATGYDVEVAGAGRLPTVSLFANRDYSDFYGSPAVRIASEFTANAGVRVSIPIFQGGRTAALQRQAGARASAAFEQVIAAERNAIAQVRAAYSSWQASNAIIESSITAVSAAELSLEGTRAENSIGNRTILDVLNAEQELLSARVQLVTARRNAYVAGFSLLAAMGRAEARDLGLGDEGLLYDPTLNYDRVKGRVWDWDRDPEPAATATRTVDIPAPDADIPPVESAPAESTGSGQ
ncbi:TolC family outer membrane protein [Pontixanthobacter aestiaquae]|uniref:TolC family outer membrane protein n=1 Tax=Pontixanthobacter aestiaquae TaxID=1509367 RepID=A0A844Z4X0_9SPHN|nr:TolC family outer membrane protein [Pontixanthobacter aestiaquae]MDN3646871.1 TolC family outer membrane protein [Pontixanthobacter aestiaquae]MXO82147.1 TolC family outer membrane protein [Pontixanthobacter aestiaquae]